jgi:vancomycin resistance protein YoaR
MTFKHRLLISFVAILLVFSGAYFWEQQRVLPEGVDVLGIDLGAMNRKEATAALQEPVQLLQTAQVHFMEGEKALASIPVGELGMEYDLSKTVTQAFDQHSWIVNALASEKSASELLPVFLLDKSRLERRVEEMLLELEDVPKNAELVWADERRGWMVAPEKLGKGIIQGDSQRVVADVLAQAYDLSLSKKVALRFQELHPDVNKEDLMPMAKDLKEKTQEPFVLKDLQEDQQVEWHLKEQEQWVSFPERGGYEVAPSVLHEKALILAEQWNEKASTVTIKEVVKEVSEYDGKEVTRAVYDGEFIHGRELDIDTLKSTIQAAFLDPSLPREIELTWKQLVPRVVSQVEGYSFPQRISTGVSSYRWGNGPNRVKNIKLSLESLQGVIIEPGEEFSFNRATGWITPSKGYTRTKIIESGRVADGVGGGVCQSSTTFFRTVLNAGLPLTERRNHSLDIHYYHEFGYGLDATVYTDARSDFQFVNDFEYPLLVNVYTDNEKYHAFAEFYGTTDEREVVLTNIPTGNYLYKKWEWKIVWPEKEETRFVESKYIVPREEEEEEAEETNPLEA